MDTFQILSYLGKSLMDTEIISLLVQLYKKLTSNKYKKILKQDPELNEMVSKLKKKLEG